MRQTQARTCILACLSLLYLVPARAFADEFREYVADSTARYSQVAFSPDGLIVGAAGTFSRLPRGLAILWDVETGEVIARLTDFPEGCSRIVFSPNNAFVAVGCGNGSIHLFGRNRDIWRRLDLIQMRPKTNYVHAEEFKFTPDGKFLVSTRHDRNVMPQSRHFMVCRGVAVIPVDGQAEQRQFAPLQPCQVTALHLLDNNGRRVVLNGAGFEASPGLAVIDSMAAEVITTISLPRPDRTIESSLTLQATRDGKTIAAECAGKVYRIDPESFEVEQQFVIANSIRPYSGMSLSSDGTLLATCSLNNLIQLWNFNTGTQLASREQPLVRSVQLSDDGKLLATTATQNKAVRVWNVTDLIEAR